MTSVIFILFFILQGAYSFQATAVFVHNIDDLISKANIYYQKPATSASIGELILSEVEQLPTKTDIKLIIHGFTSSRSHFSITPLRNAYLAKGKDNVLLADWSDAAGVDYPTSRKAIVQIAKQFGEQLKEFMDKHEIAPADVHVIGHSLGAHVAGNLGDYFNGTLGRVTGLDPALPLFTPLSVDGLHHSAAQFVDVIHTDFPVFGDGTPRGNVDFYPNFGTAPQPGCADMDVLLIAKQLLFEQYSCSHNRAVFLYAESIGQPASFPAASCTLSGIKTLNVNGCRRKVDESEVIYMGEEVSRSATGYFYLPTNDAPPFGMGANTNF
ncbi:PREDICTED: endothelial lipase [Rhagoletis zephyria]|uniref:endothelial lipase n=1 Tax=Rhagoletis zephyria TaxID=28612 RepID=UPI0008115292|nr:PREDICTED: endothelial lipase [Rhagoletis zephyria]